MKILMLLASLNPADGGPPEAIRALSRAFVDIGHEVEVATLDDPADPWLGGVSGRVTALGPGLLKYRYSRRLRPWLRRRARDFDVVIVNGVWQYHSLAAWSVLRRSRTPYIVFTHGMLDPWFRRRYPLKHVKKLLYWPWADYRVLRDARAVFFTTEDERLLARQSFSRYRANEIVVGFGTSPPPPGDPAAQVEAFLAGFPQLRGRRLLLFLSRIDPKKGCDLLLEAFARTAARAPDAHLVIAGPDSIGWRRTLEARAEALGIAGRMTWTGMLSGDLKWGAFRAADAFALPSHSENFGIVVVEALACGTPVLISNRVNIWRPIEAAGAGFIGDDTVDGATETLERWLALDERERARMRSAAHAAFGERFAMDAVAANMLRAIADTIGVSRH